MPERLQVEMRNQISEGIRVRRPSFREEVARGSYAWPKFTSIQDMYTPRDVAVREMAEIILRTAYQIQQLLTSDLLIEELFKQHEAVCFMGLYRDPGFGFGGDGDPVWRRIDFLGSYISLPVGMEARSYLAPFFNEFGSALSELGDRFRRNFSNVEFDSRGNLVDSWYRDNTVDIHFANEEFFRVEQVGPDERSSRIRVEFAYARPE